MELDGEVVQEYPEILPKVGYDLISYLHSCLKYIHFQSPPTNKLVETKIGNFNSAELGKLIVDHEIKKSHHWRRPGASSVLQSDVLNLHWSQCHLPGNYCSP